MKLGVALLLFSALFAHEYTISIFGIPIVEVNMEQENKSALTFETNTVGIFDVFWPTENNYQVSFDSTTYGIRSFEKKIKQGTFSQKLEAKYDIDSGVFKYKDGPEIKISDSCKTVLSMLGWVQNTPKEELDSKWFQMEHEGDLYLSRFLHAGSSKVLIDKDSVQTDHYRLDFKLIESGNFLDRTDYFMENIVMPDMIKQLWIDQRHPHKILQASVSIWNIDVKAVLHE